MSVGIHIGSAAVLDYHGKLYSLPLNSVNYLPQHSNNDKMKYSYTGLESHHNSISFFFLHLSIYLSFFRFFSCTGQMFVLTRRCPCWGLTSLVSRLLPAWLRCGNRAAPATDGVSATREGTSKNVCFCLSVSHIYIDPLQNSEFFWSSAIAMSLPFISSTGTAVAIF